MKKVSEASIRKAEHDNLCKLFRSFTLFATWSHVFKGILLVSIEVLKSMKRKIFKLTLDNLQEKIIVAEEEMPEAR